MKNILVLIAFLFSVALFGQTKSIDVKIDSIVTDDSNPKERLFTISYHIENLTGNAVSFFLRPNTLIANAASSLTLFPIYKIYQNNSFTTLDGPFYERVGNDDWNKYLEMKDKNSEEAQTLIKKITTEYEVQKKSIVDDYRKNGGKVEDELWIIKNHHLLQSRITLKPKEIKTFTIKTNWNKERYFLQDDLEYYLNEKDKYAFELTLHLIKTHFKDKLSPEEFHKISSDQHFIEGIFTSNKVNLNFGN